MGFVSRTLAGVSQSPWVVAGTLTTSQAALTTDKSAATVNALTSTGIVKITPANNTPAIDIRFRGVTDADSNVVNIYAMADPAGDGDHYTRIITLTLTTGTQTDGTNLFIDTITSSNEKWVDDIVVVSDAANGIAHVELNTHGYTHFLVIATTLANDSLIVDYRKV